jgi:hypothetical protein
MGRPGQDASEREAQLSIVRLVTSFPSGPGIEAGAIPAEITGYRYLAEGPVQVGRHHEDVDNCMDELTCAKLHSIFEVGLSVLPAVQRDIITKLYFADLRISRKGVDGRTWTSRAAIQAASRFSTFTPSFCPEGIPDRNDCSRPLMGWYLFSGSSFVVSGSALDKFDKNCYATFR